MGRACSQNGGEDRSAFKILTRKPIGKKRLGRPRRRWEDNIRMELEEIGISAGNWVGFAQGKGLLEIPCECGIEPPGFISHGVSSSRGSSGTIGSGDSGNSSNSSCGGIVVAVVVAIVVILIVAVVVVAVDSSNTSSSSSTKSSSNLEHQQGSPADSALALLRFIT